MNHGIQIIRVYRGSGLTRDQDWLGIRVYKGSGLTGDQGIQGIRVYKESSQVMIMQKTSKGAAGKHCLRTKVTKLKILSQ